MRASINLLHGQTVKYSAFSLCAHTKTLLWYFAAFMASKCLLATAKSFKPLYYVEETQPRSE